MHLILSYGFDNTYSSYHEFTYISKSIIQIVGTGSNANRYRITWNGYGSQLFTIELISGDISKINNNVYGEIGKINGMDMIKIRKIMGVNL